MLHASSYHVPPSVYIVWFTYLSINYSSFDKIDILNDANTSNTFNTFWECVEDNCKDYTGINEPKNSEQYQKLFLDIQNSHSYNKK